VVTVPARRELVRFAQSRGLSERRALRLACLSPSVLRYERRDDGSGELRKRIMALAHRHRRHGYRMIHLRLTQEGWTVNIKRVRRLYRQESLMVQKRKRKKVASRERQPLVRPSRANEVWSMDFVFDRLADGRALKCLSVADDATQEAVTVMSLRDADPGPGKSPARPAEGDPLGQRVGVLRARDGDLGARERCGTAFHRAGQTQPERLRRVLQRTAAR